MHRSLAFLAALLICALASPGAVRAQQESADQVKAQADAAFAAHKWQEAYTLYLRAQSDYISEGNQKAADDLRPQLERVKQAWFHPSTHSSSSTSSSGVRGRWSQFTAHSGTPNGSYSCSAMVMRFIGTSSVGPGSMPLRTPQLMQLSPITFSPGHYVLNWNKTGGTWSGSGTSLRLSGKQFENATAAYGTNGQGRPTVRFTFPVTNADPVIWMCTR